MARPLEELTLEELWRIFPIELSPPQPAWRQRYLEEAEALHRVLGRELWRIHHIGSTSVPGLAAKPVVDLLLEIDPAANLDGITVRMQRLGYRLSPQPHKPPPHRMYLKGYTPEGYRGQPFHAHIRYPGDWEEVAFRDYLAAHPETAAEYAALKQELAARYRYDRDGYTNAKGEFIQRVNRLARKSRA